MRITVISDTHSKHRELKLPGGDLLIHSGDFSSMGYQHEIKNFCEWFSQQDYRDKIFIAGNHELGLQDHRKDSMTIINSYKNIDYLEEDLIIFNEEDYENSIKIFGTPWQLEFCNWAFNLKAGEELQEKLDNILTDIDILITHNPPYSILDSAGPPINESFLGCPQLFKKVKEIKPKIHIFGHIHGGYGYKFYKGTHFINAASLDEYYNVKNDPITFDWNKKSNILNFV